MNPHIAMITIGVADLDRSKRFYADLGWPIAVEQGQYVASLRSSRRVAGHDL